MGGGGWREKPLWTLYCPHVNEQSGANMANQEIILDTITASCPEGGTDLLSLHQAHLQNIFRISTIF